ncbi:MAG: metallophosphoesterase [Clostridiales bacterium]|nr:metallophosphoesterase [Clostridiales bacterium]
MKILVIPDVHLKPYIFDEARNITEVREVDNIVCLGDIVDDWGQENNITLYEKTLDAMISFAKDYPDALWCWGNHDISYIWQALESGYSGFAENTVRLKLGLFERTLREHGQLAFIHRVDEVLFVHGGLSEEFVRGIQQKYQIPESEVNDIDALVRRINMLRKEDMWKDDSPLWLRPQYGRCRLFKSDEYLQVVGHTPVYDICLEDGFISTDVFSTRSDGKSIGRPGFLIIDTVTRETTVLRKKT